MHHSSIEPAVLLLRPLDRLSVKQALATLLIALVLGAVTGGWELWSDFQIQHQQVQDKAEADLSLVRGLAVEAAFQLSPDLAGEVVNGLARDPATARVLLTDNYGGVLGEVRRPPATGTFPAVARSLFGDVTHYEMTLVNRGADGTQSTVGSLAIDLDPDRLLDAFLPRLLATVVGGLAHTALLCGLVVAVFYAMITKPLLRLTATIAAVDPARPGARPIAVPVRHEGDELGLLATAINSMLAQSQRGLDGRDKAEAELAALARDLEHRVEARTAELAREKASVEQANRDLEKANFGINESIRYASRLQAALLPDAGALDGVVADLAVGWHPLDMVGGDYYWLGRFGSKAVVVLFDCTGHGVPGAFMTAVAASALARVLHHHGHDDPAEILAQLHRLVQAALRQDRGGAVSNDGLDAAVCVVDAAARRLSYAGARLPLLLRSAEGFRLIRGDRCSLGYAETPADIRFTRRDLALSPGDSFYLYTDGVIDQVGGPKRRLFGRNRMVHVLEDAAALPLAAQMAAVFDQVGAWRGDERPRDDMTFLAFQPLARGEG